MKKKIIIVGASSGVGKYLLNKLKKKFTVTGWTSKKGLSKIMYINFKKERFLKEINKFDCIIYCSTISGFDASNQNLVLSKFVNIGILQKIIKKMKPHQKLIFISTYGVTSKFKNQKPAYIKHKMNAEKIIKKKLQNFFIIRPAKIIDTIEPFQNQKKLKNFKFYENKFIYITTFILIYKAILKVLRHNYTGLLNLVSNDKISYVELAKNYLGKSKINATKYLTNRFSHKDTSKLIKNKKFLSLYKNSIKIIKDAKKK